jgi:sigma-B regulation protein RsbU (phosphoserine phosphatase)
MGEATQRKTAPGPSDELLRNQLLERRARLAAVIPRRADGAPELRGLLGEVDAALGRLEAGTLGICEGCRESIEGDRLIAEPLIRVCLGCLDERQTRALERDLELAAAVQGALLPAPRVGVAGWEIGHRYRPHGPVSGDHCDVLLPKAESGPVHVALGDVSGKGISASILMAHLQAALRALSSMDLPLATLVERANRLFCESTVPSSFATLVVGRLHPAGVLELCNAGHCPPVLVRDGRVSSVASGGMPLGVYPGERYTAVRIDLAPEDLLFAYTDGLSEAQDREGGFYGMERVETVMRGLTGRAADDVLERFLGDVDRFRGAVPLHDDLTVMAIRRTA